MATVEVDEAATDAPIMALAASASESVPSGWEFSVTPYIWFTGLDGDIGVFPQVPPVNVGLSFGDVLDNLEFAGMVAFTARKGRFVAVVDVSYVDVGTSTEVSIPDSTIIDIRLDSETFTSTIAAGYRAVDQGALFLDLLGGLRISTVDTELVLTGPTRTLMGDSSESWVDPVVGARFRAPLGENWAFALYGDIGGFGVSSDLTWQLVGTVQLTLSRHWRLAAGWRHYAIDYEKDGFIYDVSMSGPIIGASYSF